MADFMRSKQGLVTAGWRYFVVSLCLIGSMRCIASEDLAEVDFVAKTARDATPESRSSLLQSLVPMMAKGVIRKTETVPHGFRFTIPSDAYAELTGHATEGGVTWAISLVLQKPAKEGTCKQIINDESLFNGMTELASHAPFGPPGMGIGRKLVLNCEIRSAGDPAHWWSVGLFQSGGTMSVSRYEWEDEKKIVLRMTRLGWYESAGMAEAIRRNAVITESKQEAR